MSDIVWMPYFILKWLSGAPLKMRPLIGTKVMGQLGAFRQRVILVWNMHNGPSVQFHEFMKVFKWIKVIYWWSIKIMKHRFALPWSSLNLLVFNMARYWFASDDLEILKVAARVLLWLLEVMAYCTYGRYFLQLYLIFIKLTCQPVYVCVVYKASNVRISFILLAFSCWCAWSSMFLENSMKFYPDVILCKLN